MEYFHLSSDGRWRAMIPVCLPGKTLKHIPSPSWIRVQEDGFFYIQGPHPNSSGREWELQMVNELELIAYRVPTTPLRFALQRPDWKEPPDWLAKLFQHAAEWMDRAEVKMSLATRSL
jgi:hypothetical protein